RVPRSLPPVSPAQEAATEEAPTGLFAEPQLFLAEDLSEAEIGSVWPNRRHEEVAGDGRVLSFFTAGDRHVVLRAKELRQERATGAILRTRQAVTGDPCLLSSTCYMRGAFLSQVALGNLSMNIAVTISRDPLHVLRAAGMRVFLHRNGQTELLGVPSAFENTPTSCRWLYLSDDDRIEVTVWAGQGTQALYLHLQSALSRQFTIFTGLAMGDAGCQPAFADVAKVGDAAVVLRPAPGGRFAERYPDGEARLVPEDASLVRRLGDDHLLYADGASRGSSALVMETRSTESFRLAITGRLLAEDTVPTHEELFSGMAATAEIESGTAFHRRLLGLDMASDDARISSLQTMLPWLVQNAMVHLTAPHGLEQYLGAAWGTRDVCQGSVEMLLALGHCEQAREIIRTVLANQDVSGTWRQWFMFDRNADIRAGDAHGDVVFWPLRALCEYVEASNDLSFLDEQLPYYDGAAVAETVVEHVGRALAAVRGEFVPGTALVRYGHGDWNDSLQPADPELAKSMVSSWTVALCCQTLRGLAKVFEQAGRSALARNLRVLLAQAENDFRKHLIHDGTVCGFAVLDDAGQARPLLHPQDQETGIHYRLLPMIRGIIADVFDVGEANHHADLIQQHLVAPDGARLMDRPPQYRGGTMRIFQRGETATFFGREIGIMYVHAHLRYLGAMARLGRPAAVLDGLMKIVPVDLQERLPQAVMRQSNAYFSSSDAAFADREQADREYDRVKDGSVAVKGGWRIYSSGPGLVLQLVVRHLLGIRFHYGDIIFDPSLPEDLDELSVDWQLCGCPVCLRYRRTGTSQLVLNGEAFAARPNSGRHRQRGVALSREAFAGMLRAEGNEIVIEF
ncbi:MAG: cellobiose phosphorylase, partial [Victivallales bacterium]|nr:cellobiose phosphorylase [Victivallales bacterium]